MACMKLGSKANIFHLEGQNWLCTTGLPSDVCIEVGEISFHLHKFPLLSRSQLLEKLIQDFPSSQKSEETTKCILSLQDLPGGPESFLLVAKFCYGVRFELTATNVVSLRCAAEYLQMSEDYGEGNLISQSELFLDQALGSWLDTIKALETCTAALPLSEELHIIARCIDSLAAKACADPTLFSWPTSAGPRSPTEDWWYNDAAILELSLFKRLIFALRCKGMTPDRVGGSVMFYAKRYLPLNGRKSSFHQINHPGSRMPVLSDAEQRSLIEEIIELLPDQKGAAPTTFLLRLLRTSMILGASESCRETLERRIGAQLDQALLQDLLIPNTSDSSETLYEVECVQRIVERFLDLDQDDDDSNSSSAVEEEQLVEGFHSLTPMTTVANLLDDYLAEVASDANLKLEKFLLLAAAIPDYARPLDDGIYRAIDIYLKAHPRLTDSEREQLCRLMNCQKLSLEASSHAAQNERLPLRVIVQVLFFEQLRLRTFVAGWFFVSDNLDQSQNLSGNERSIPTSSRGDRIIRANDVRERVCELERKCDGMKHEMEKLVKTKRSWIIDFYKRFGLKVRTKSFDLKTMLHCNGEAIQPSRRAVLDRKNKGGSKLAD